MAVSKPQLMARVLLDVLLLIAVIEGWWILAIPFGFIGARKFRYYFEMFCAGIMYDALFGLVSGQSWRGHVGLIAALVLYILHLGMRRVVRK